MGLLSPTRPDPTVLAPVGAYLTDGEVLVEVLETEMLGAIGENVVSSNLQEIKPDDLVAHYPAGRPHWRRVYPARDSA